MKNNFFACLFKEPDKIMEGMLLNYLVTLNG